ncbi:hypothetical protein BGZ46_006334 [Entomortierella lignicola]|nr:hypothetical protein BGZ46_006334 [Entomortierella lignicola]
MSASRRKISSGRSNALEHSSAPKISGAEMLVLQQNIKQYIITRQSRPLTTHELEEFEKIKEQLLPNLLRYSQSTGPSLTEDSSNSSSSSKQGKTVLLKPNRKISVPPPVPPEIYPTSELSSSRAEPSYRTPTLSTHAKTKTGPKLKQLTIKESLNPAANLTRSISTSDVVANAAKGGEKKKRPRIDVYHDPENTDKKRRRRKAKDDTGDSDKENRNPLDSAPSKQNKRVLGDNTNIANNATKSLDPKGKNNASKPVVSKTGIVNATTDTPKTTSRTQKKSNMPLASQAVPSTTNVSTKNVKQKKKSQATVFQDTDPIAGGAQFVTITQDRAIETSTDVTIVNPQVILQDDAANEPEKLIERSPVEAQSQRGSKPIKAPTKTPTSATPANEVLASLADDDAASFEPYVRSKGDKSPVIRRSAVEPQEVQGSEDSVEIYIPDGSQEEQTFPMPEFLADVAPEDSEEQATLPMPNFLGQDLPEDPREEPTLPMPGFLLGDQLEEQSEQEEELEEGPTTVINSPSSQSWEETVAEFHTTSMFDTEASESSVFSEGVWCISDYKCGVNTTICGNTKQWIAVETNLHVQFWQLNNCEDLSDGRWCRRFQLRKASNYPTQVVFAPDDSFAIVLNPLEHTLVKVSLKEFKENEDAVQPEPLHVKVNWSGVMPSLTCQSFIIECASETGSEISSRLVFGTDEPGSICIMTVPDYFTSSEATLSPKTLCYLGTNELASSIAKIENTSSLVLASFGTAMVLWDLDDCLEPVSVADASYFLSPLPSPLPTAPLMAPIILSATVPKNFFKEYESMLQSKRLSPSDWPILTVLMMCDTEVDDSGRNESERCGLYAIKGDSIELIHKYIGSQSSSMASSSLRFVACQTKLNGKDSLYIWDILKPEAVLQLSLFDSPSQQEFLSQTQHQKKELPRLDMTITNFRGKLSNNSLDIFSDASTLSPPPTLLSSQEHLNLNSVDQLPEPTLSHGGQRHQQRQPKEWIDLTSVSWMVRKRVQFSVQKGYHWALVVQHEMSKPNSSVVHVVDLRSILSTSA